jgi:hypothetical protein
LDFARFFGSGLFFALCSRLLGEPTFPLPGLSPQFQRVGRNPVTAAQLRHCLRPALRRRSRYDKLNQHDGIR